MTKRAIALLLGVTFLCAIDVSATPGTFRGKIVGPPSGKEHDGWLYIQGRNKMLRRVSIAKARIVYSEQVPERQREKIPAKGLAEGTEVRVTAEQDEAGEWRALRIEILKVPVASAAGSVRTV
jgi:hypothetical protein